MDAISLYELQRQLKEGVQDVFPELLWVQAEVAQIQRRSNGHCYLELAQSEEGTLLAKARAVIWRNRYVSISRAFADATGSQLQAGISILALVEVSYSELYGLTLVIEDIEPRFTLGEAELCRQRTLGRLGEENLLDRQQSLQLPSLPYNLAVISAADAAGYGDFCRHLEGNEYGFKYNVQLFEAAMQGTSAPASIADALRSIESSQVRYDAVLIIRGGGSSLDLACFDDYELCRSIAECTVPVFTAIGHDKDFHVADRVAFLFVKTPTALADEFIAAYAAEDERLASFEARLKLAFSSRIAEMESRLEQLAARIEAANPRNLLAKGYSLVTDGQGIVIKSPENVKIGEKITILFENGRINAEVLSKQE